MKLTRFRKIFLSSAIVIIVVVGSLAIYLYPSFKSFLKTETVKYDDKLTFVIGGGGNSGILSSDSAVVVIDTKMGSAAKDLYNSANSLAGNKPLIVINTHYHSDHTAGNKLYKGREILIGAYDQQLLDKEINKDGAPTRVIKDSLILNLGDEIARIYNVGVAHTTNDMIVYLEKRKVLFAGDLVFNKIHPVLMKNSGVDVNKWINVLIMIKNRFDINTVVPGHGAAMSKDCIDAEINYFQDMKAAATNPEIEKAMKKKYDGYNETPFLSSFSKTLYYIQTNVK